MKIRMPVAVALLAFCGALTGKTSPEAAATIVLYNRADPDSAALAKYYAKKREIPVGQLIGLPCSSEEEISRDAYDVTIAAPLRAAFTKFGWWQFDRDEEERRVVVAAKMRFVAVMRGVPMKIRPDGTRPPSDYSKDIQPGSPTEMLMTHNEASVDSELAGLFAPDAPTAAFLSNPYYRRLVPILQFPVSESPLLVCRLDGPSAGVVRRMIDASLASERQGLWGWAYLDARGITAGPYAEGDAWLTQAAVLMRRQGIPVISDFAAETLPKGFPVSDAAIYYGWYAADVNGPFAEKGPHFVSGAIAVHLHSFSARTVRDPKVAWAAPLLVAGADATMGNVYEPFLELTVHFDILQDRLMNGLTLAESAYAATRGLSWMAVVFGDPLYRPYAKWLDIQEDPGASNIWRRYRQAVLAAGDTISAAPALRALSAESKNSMPLEGLGQAQAAAGSIDAALETLDAAAAMERASDIRFRIVLEQIEILRRVGRLGDARRRVAAALEAFPTSQAELVLGRLVLELGPAATVKP